ncbi:MAG: glycosyltransferase family 2 protein [Actinomycetota bacterium]|nr:glycosyltransferase family 2 protein [Actinomycetota bacterium]
MGKATSNWIFSIDTDEYVTEELEAEVEDILRNPDPDIGGYFVPRRNFLGKRRMKFATLYPDYQLRLFVKKGTKFRKAVHETVEIKKKKGYLKNDLIHLTYVDVAGYVNRINRYTSLEAEAMFKKGRKSKLTDFVRPPILFLKLYLLKLGILDGFIGLVNSIFLIFYSFLKYAKLRELYMANSKNEEKIS